VRPRAIFSLVLICLSAGCSSKSTAVKSEHYNTGPNTQHWKGTTETLQNYRLPGRFQERRGIRTKDVTAASRVARKRRDKQK
jgi:hypothetical protein